MSNYYQNVSNRPVDLGALIKAMAHPATKPFSMEIAARFSKIYNEPKEDIILDIMAIAQRPVISNPMLD